MRAHRISMSENKHASFPLAAFIRASTLHVGAAAAAAALRRELVEEGRLPGAAFDEAYAVARITPGTNLLAMYTVLGERFAGWPGAVGALTVGTLVPAAITLALGIVYAAAAHHPLAASAMQGAHAGALAVFVWSIVRLIRPQLREHGVRAIVAALVTLTIALLFSIPQFALLLLAAGVGAASLRNPA